MSYKGTLYLIPNFLGDPANSPVLIPGAQLEVIRPIREFIVENSKNARACLKALNITTPQNEIIVHELDKHNPSQGIGDFLKSAVAGGTIGLLSDAGVPCVADPGSIVVKAAHQKGIKVVPIVGASSILLALMASGFNGQSFTFHGYLPVDAEARVKKLRLIEKDSRERNQTQVFIETPYRNHSLIADILKTCSPQSRFCLACNLTSTDETIISQPIAAWKSIPLDFHKKPAVFLLYAG